MTSIGHNGWLKCNLVADSMDNITEPFRIEFDCKPQVMPFQDAADYTAKLIAEKYNNIHLFLSGGIDSEFVAKVLLRNKIPFTPVILDAEYNRPESWYAHKFCHENNIEPLVYMFTGSSGHHELVKSLCSIAIKLKLPVNISLINNVFAKIISADAHILNGFGEPFYNSTTFSQPMGETLEIADHDFFMETEYGDRHPGAFFTYTPELYSALIKEIDFTANTQIAKASLYGVLPRSKNYTHFFDMFPSKNIELILHRAFSTLKKDISKQMMVINRNVLLQKFST